jgi:hypothetical protein
LFSEGIKDPAMARVKKRNSNIIIKYPQKPKEFSSIGDICIGLWLDKDPRVS